MPSVGYTSRTGKGGSGDRERAVSEAFDTIVGKVCLEKGWVTREQLVECLRECGSSVDDSPSSSSRSRLSDVLVSRGIVKPDDMAQLHQQVSKILESSDQFTVVRNRDSSLGQLLVKGGAVKKEHLIEALSMQGFASSKGGAPPRLGEILLQKGYVTFAALEQALGLQKQKQSLACSICGAAYSVVDYDPKKKYLCKKCTGPLLPPRQAQSDIPEEVTKARANPKNVLGKYVAVKELGRGGMGAVYQAWDTVLKRWVALKVLVGTGARDEVARFKREAQTAAALRHPSIVGIYEVTELGDKHAISMEYIDGSSLAGGKLPAMKAAEIMAEVAEAVEYAHTRGIVHRDIKPHNVMLNREGRPFVMDFGLAKSIEGPSHITMAGTVVGTPSYMSPEQAEGRVSQVGKQSDVWSLGAVLYEVLTGRPPFKGTNPVETLKMVVQDDPVPPSRFNPAVLKDLETIVLKCLEKDRGRRYASAQALADDLRRFLRGQQIGARRAPVGAKLAREVRRRWVPIAAAGAAVVALAVGITVLASGSGRAQQVQSLIRKGETQVEGGDLKNALLQFQTALALDPGNLDVQKRIEDLQKRLAAADAEAERRKAEEERKRAEAAKRLAEARAKVQPEIDQGRSKLDRAQRSLYQAGADFAQTDQLLQEAAEHFGRAIALVPDLPTAYHLRGQVHFIRQNWPAAEKDFSAAIAALATFSAALYDRGRTFLEMAADALGQERIRGPVAEEEARAFREKAKADLAAYRKLGGGDAEQAEFAEAMLAASEQNHPKAIEICERLIARKTNNEEVYKLKADACYALGDRERDKARQQARYRQAAEAYSMAIDRRVNYPEAWLQRGHMLFHLEDRDGAIRDLEKAVSMNRPSASWYSLRAGIQYEMGRNAEALADFERALQLSPNDAGILNNLGTLYYQQKEYARSKDCYDRVLAVNAKNADALAGRGAARLAINDTAGALDDFNEALRLAPEKKDIRYRIAVAYYTRREWIKAEEEFTAYLSANPNAEQAHYYRAFCRYHQARYREAIQDWETCLSLGSRKAEECQKNIASAKKQLGEP